MRLSISMGANAWDDASKWKWCGIGASYTFWIVLIEREIQVVTKKKDVWNRIKPRSLAFGTFENRYEKLYAHRDTLGLCRCSLEWILLRDEFSSRNDEVERYALYHLAWNASWSKLQLRQWHFSALASLYEEFDFQVNSKDPKVCLWIAPLSGP